MNDILFMIIPSFELSHQLVLLLILLGCFVVVAVVVIGTSELVETIPVEVVAIKIVEPLVVR